ncbi:hypothetical protein PPGU19_011890 [Paraburkholderia sp. PGU19]|nr:hypothetical protein PPGU19_011890 [Paraburkholderia sp. PGU19]
MGPLPQLLEVPVNAYVTLAQIDLCSSATVDRHEIEMVNKVMHQPIAQLDQILQIFIGLRVVRCRHLQTDSVPEHRGTGSNILPIGRRFVSLISDHERTEELINQDT